MGGQASQSFSKRYLQQDDRANLLPLPDIRRLLVFRTCDALHNWAVLSLNKVTLRQIDRCISQSFQHFTLIYGAVACISPVFLTAIITDNRQ